MSTKDCHNNETDDYYRLYSHRSLTDYNVAFRVLRQLSDSNIFFCFTELTEYTESGKIIPDGCLDHLIRMYKDAGGTAKTEKNIAEDLLRVYMDEMGIRHLKRLSNRQLDKVERWKRSGEKTVRIIKATATRNEPWNYAVIPAQNAERFLIQVFPDKQSAREFILQEGYILADEKMKHEIADKKERILSSPIVGFIDRDSIRTSRSFSFKIPFYKLEAATGISFQLSEGNPEKALEFWIEYEDRFQSKRHHLVANVWVTEPGGDFREHIDTICFTTDEEIPVDKQMDFILQRLGDCEWLCEKTSSFISAFIEDNG